VTGQVKLGASKRDRWYTLISAIIFVIAMTQPAFYQTRRDDTVMGSAMCLAIGGMGLPFEGADTNRQSVQPSLLS
jgi:hypothetical protein